MMMAKMRMAKLFDIYRNFSVVKKSMFWYTVSNVMVKGVAVITMPIFTRVMTEEQYGLVNLYASWSALFMPFASLTVSSCILIGMQRFDNREAFLSGIQGLSLILMLFWAALFVLFHRFISHMTGLSTILLIALCVEAFFQNQFISWSNYQRVQYKYKSLVAVSVFAAILSSAVSLIAVLNITQLESGIVQILSKVSVNSIIVAIVFIAVFVKGKVFFNKEHWKFALTFSIPLIFHSLSFIVLNNSDRIMIEKYCGLEETAYYSVAYNSALVPMLISGALGSAYAPWFYEKLKQGDFGHIRKRLDIMLMIFAFIPLLIALIGPEIVRILAPANYSAAVWVIPPVSASVFFSFLYGYFIQIQYYYSRTLLIGVTSISVALSNIVLNYIFLPKFGFIAAGYTTLFCYMIFALAHFFITRKICKQKFGGMPMYHLKFYLIVSGVFFVISQAISFTYELAWLRYAIILFMIAIAVLKRHAVIEIVTKSENKADIK